MQATVVVEKRTAEGVVVRIVDATSDGGLSPLIALRFETASLEEDAAFLQGRSPVRIPDPGSFVTFKTVDVVVDGAGIPSLVAGPLADLAAVGDPSVLWMGWTDVEAAVAQAAARIEPDEGILYVDAGGTPFVVDFRGAYLLSSERDKPRTATECGLDGPLPAEAGFYFFAGEPWSAVDKQSGEFEHAWGMTLTRVEPLTIAHMPNFGRSSLEGLHRLAAAAGRHPKATLVGPAPSI